MSDSNLLYVTVVNFDCFILQHFSDDKSGTFGPLWELQLNSWLNKLIHFFLYSSFQFSAQNKEHLNVDVWYMVEGGTLTFAYIN